MEASGRVKILSFRFNFEATLLFEKVRPLEEQTCVTDQVWRGRNRAAAAAQVLIECSSLANSLAPPPTLSGGSFGALIGSML